MNIVLINHYAGHPDLGMEFRPYYLAREWVKQGHKVTIVCSSFSHLRRNKQLNALYQSEIIDGIDYLWFKTPSYSSNGFARVVNMMTFVLLLLVYSFRISKKIKPDVVIASSTYPLDIYPAKLIAKVATAKLFFEVHDLWPLSPIELGGMSTFHPFIVMMQMAENFAYRNADVTVSMLPCAKEYMLGHGLMEEKYLHIPNGVSVTEWCSDILDIPSAHSEVLTALKDKGKFIFGYAGGHAISNSLETIIDAAGRINNRDIVFVLVGDGVEKKNIVDLAASKGLDNVVFLPPVPKKSMPSLLAFFDCNLLTWSNSPLYRFGVSPNKIFDYMMSAKPIIQALTAGNDIIRESCSGISVPSGDIVGLVDAINKMVNMSTKEREALGESGYQYVLENHNYQVLSEKFISVIKKI